MIETEYGQFEGDTWEKTCQICFKIKYESQQYIEIIASPGDFGIEGFTNTGKAFQCYCPDSNYTQEELYEKQRDKITTDLNKLSKNEVELKKRLGSTKIKEWIFLTPKYSKNDIVAHCEKKTQELRRLNLSILADNFVVLPQDIDFLIPHIGIAISNTMSSQLSLRSPNSIPNIGKYKTNQSTLVSNAITKHSARMNQIDPKVDQNKIDTLTDRTIRNFLDGKIILDLWNNLTQDDYEKFIKIISLYEEDVEELCLTPSSDFNGRLEVIKSDLNGKVAEGFPNIDIVMVKELTNYVIADWILRCPINFN